MTGGHTANHRASRGALGIWMNNVRVGTWSRTAADVDVFAYDLAWTNAEQGRPLSLTLPFLPGNGEHRGAHVANWFENLLPDSTEIRSRIARRFGVRAAAGDRPRHARGFGHVPGLARTAPALVAVR